MWMPAPCVPLVPVWSPTTAVPTSRNASRLTRQNRVELRSESTSDPRRDLWRRNLKWSIMGTVLTTSRTCRHRRTRRVKCVSLTATRTYPRGSFLFLFFSFFWLLIIDNTLMTRLNGNYCFLVLLRWKYVLQSSPRMSKSPDLECLARASLLQSQLNSLSTPLRPVTATFKSKFWSVLFLF